jgi:hypothetical protein
LPARSSGAVTSVNGILYSSSSQRVHPSSIDGEKLRKTATRRAFVSESPRATQRVCACTVSGVDGAATESFTNATSKP